MKRAELASACGSAPGPVGFHMSEQKSHRILGIVYFNPDDPRVIVPMRSKLGMTVNFGHPRAVTALGWICALALLAFVVAPIIAHPLWFAREPADLVWIAAASLTALGIVRLNNWFAWSDYRLLSVASFGVLAAGVGFAVQGLINGPLVLWWGSHLTWRHHLVLGPVAAASQTFGKWFALLLLFKVKPSSSSRDCLRYGLLVGLGFALWEITILYFRVAWAQVPVGYLNLWERGSSSMFHIYSAGLIAVALRSRRYWLILLVVGIHALTDFLAGAGGTLGLSIYSLESIFSACAIFVWVAFLLAGRAIAVGVLFGAEIQPDGPANGSQPFCSEIDRASSASDSRR